MFILQLAHFLSEFGIVCLLFFVLPSVPGFKRGVFSASLVFIIFLCEERLTSPSEHDVIKTIGTFCLELQTKEFPEVHRSPVTVETQV